MPVDPRLLGSPGLPPEADVLRRLSELEAAIARLERAGTPGVRDQTEKLSNFAVSGVSAVDYGVPPITVACPAATFVVVLLSLEMKAAAVGDVMAWLRLDGVDKAVVITSTIDSNIWTEYMSAPRGAATPRGTEAVYGGAPAVWLLQPGQHTLLPTFSGTGTVRNVRFQVWTLG